MPMLSADPTDGAATDTPDRDQQCHSLHWLLPPVKSTNHMFAICRRLIRWWQNLTPRLQKYKLKLVTITKIHLPLVSQYTTNR
jgi:hypothetical protein